MKRLILSSMLILGMTGNATAFGLDSLINKSVGAVVNQIDKSARTQERQERPAERYQEPERPVVQSAPQPAAKPVAKKQPAPAKTKKEAPTVADVKSTVPLTADEFKDKSAAYNDNKIKGKDFLAICDKTLTQAEADGNIDLVKRVLFARAFARAQEGNIAGAHADADRLIAESPNEENSYYAKAGAFEMDGNMDAFSETLKECATKIADPERKEFILKMARDLPLKKAAISPEVIWTAFNENEVAAEDQYKGKEVAIKGKIADITTDILGNPQISFNVDQHGFHNVHCSFEKEDRAVIAKMKKGQVVIVAGLCQGMVVQIVSLRKCRVID